ncbi:MAG: DUF2892 domain-containing protein [Bacteroidales bacterium]|jgi:hypothetical protein|nr:DUF2892 domain-containing protein [Bacteroidales bacterium]MDX9925790.1 DUF2892 domain-containing protein [Bacteroidales bacterium]HOC49356.1 DUF2892 domain-containing protein [Bacteroidales bacterium]HPS98553.1 DUF2892 domain-containing protein [Bacteroidales bacterium]
MKKNIGKTDMTVRLVLAALLVILYFFVGKITGLIFIIIAIILAVTALTRTCPLYYIFRTDTLDKKE